MKLEQKQALLALLKSAWMPIAGGLLGLIVGLFFIFIGFWKTILLLVLILLGVAGGYFLRRYLHRGNAQGGLFSRPNDDDDFYQYRNDE